MRAFLIRVLFVVVFLAPEAWSEDGFLYSDEDWQYFGSGAEGQRRSQHFSPEESTPVALGINTKFKTVGFRIALDGGENLTGTLQLFAWDTDYATSIAGPVVAEATFDTPGPADTWLQVTAADWQMSEGQYLLSLLVGTVTGTDFGLRRSTSNDGGPNNDAYNESSLKTDREYQVGIFSIAWPVEDWEIY